MKVIYDTDTKMFFKSFGTMGELCWTKNKIEALNLYNVSPFLSESTIKRMISAWFNRPFSKTGLTVAQDSVFE